MFMGIIVAHFVASTQNRCDTPLTTLPVYFIPDETYPKYRLVHLPQHCLKTAHLDSMPNYYMQGIQTIHHAVGIGTPQKNSYHLNSKYKLYR